MTTGPEHRVVLEKTAEGQRWFEQVMATRSSPRPDKRPPRCKGCGPKERVRGDAKK